ncbi:hypothetical protein H6503_05285 [Candidatus Woesearchaeota archaeon]|nr:hypothetical protein [Candidatus Woesearchaeota archaeon]
MDRTTIIVGVCAVIWLAVLSVAFTGFAIHSNSCCIGDVDDGCSAEEECSIEGSTPFSIASTMLMVLLLFSGLALMYYKLKV